MGLRETREHLSNLVEVIVAKDRRFLKVSELTMAPYKSAVSKPGQTMLRVSYMGRSLGILFHTKGKGWNGSTIAGGTKYFKGRGAQEKALKAMILQSPEGIVRKNGTPL